MRTKYKNFESIQRTTLVQMAKNAQDRVDNARSEQFDTDDKQLTRANIQICKEICRPLHRPLCEQSC